MPDRSSRTLSPLSNHRTCRALWSVLFAGSVCFGLATIDPAGTRAEPASQEEDYGEFTEIGRAHV